MTLTPEREEMIRASSTQRPSTMELLAEIDRLRAEVREWSAGYDTASRRAYRLEQAIRDALAVDEQGRAFHILKLALRAAVEEK